MEDLFLALLIIATAVGGVAFILLGLGGGLGTVGVALLFGMMGFACYLDHLA